MMQGLWLMALMIKKDDKEKVSRIMGKTLLTVGIIVIILGGLGGLEE